MSFFTKHNTNIISIEFWAVLDDMGNCTTYSVSSKTNHLKMTRSLQEHVHGFNKGITPCYISRIKHLQTPLSVDALETNPRHITICFLVLRFFLLLLLFKGIDLILSSGTDVAARFPILTLQHRNIVQEIIWPICLHSEPTSPRPRNVFN